MGKTTQPPPGNTNPPRRFPVPVQTPAADILVDQSREVIDRKNARELKPKGAENKLRESIGEYGTRRYVEQNFRRRIKSEVIITRRGQIGPHILDLVYELDNGEILVLEAKQGTAKLGRVNKKSIKMGDTSFVVSRTIDKKAATRATIKVDKKVIEQFSPQWFQDRIKEIRGKNKRLANKLERAWYDGKIRAIIVYVDDDGLVKNVVDRTDKWILFKQRSIPAEPTKTPDVDRPKTASTTKADDKPGTSVQADAPTQPGAMAEPPQKPDAAPKPSVVPDKPSAASAGKLSSTQGIKAPIVSPSVKLTLKIGAGLLLEIGAGLLDSWFEGRAQKKDWERIEPEVNRRAQKALDKANESGEIAKFRAGKNLEKGYQLYYRIALKVNTYCNDGPFSYSAYFESFEPLGVSVVRNSTAESGFPETGIDVACGTAASDATLYSPLFQFGERISTGTSHAADGRFDAIGAMMTRSYRASWISKKYLEAFFRYTRIQRDSKAAFLWAELKNDTRFKKVLVGVGMQSPWDLVEVGIPFEDVVDSVPWINPGLDEIPFIEAFLSSAEQWATIDQKARWKRYYDRLEAYKRGRKCHSSCHLPNERATDNPLLLEAPSAGVQLLRSSISVAPNPKSGGNPGRPYEP